MTPDIVPTLRAWVDYNNAHGGINGHPVKVIQLDDAASPAQALADIQKLVRQDHVIALVGNQDSAVDSTYATYLESTGVPNVGGADFSGPWTTNPDYFPTFATENTSGYAINYAAKVAGAGTLVTSYCSEQAVCLEDVKEEQKQSQLVPGVKFIIGAAASQTAPDYTAQCVAMLAKHPDVLVFGGAIAPAETMATDCRQQGFKGRWVLYQESPSELSNAALQNAVGEDIALPYFVQSAATSAFHQSMNQYAHGVQLSTQSIREWAALDVVKEALELVPNEALGPQAVKDGLYALPPGYDDNGLTPPLHFVKGQATENNCFFVWGITNGKFVMPNGTMATCMPGVSNNIAVAPAEGAS